MGVFREDDEIPISKLIKQWVAEGFLKPDNTKSLEEVAKDYLKDLIERNLVLVSKWGSIGKMKTCRIHDLLRDLCLKKGKEERFLCVVKSENHTQSMNIERRIVSHRNWSPDHIRDPLQTLRTLPSSPFIRSLTCDYELSPPLNLRLLQVAYTCSRDSILQRVNLRYLESIHWRTFLVSSPNCQFWYLQTLVLTEMSVINVTNVIWEMPELRHIIAKSGILFPTPLSGGGQENSVLKHLQTLSSVIKFKCTEEVLNRIPNVKKLKIKNTKVPDSLHNLCRLHKLQSLGLTAFTDTNILQNIAFPESLTKLELGSCYFNWGDVTTKIGSLPHLEKLRMYNFRAGAEWNTVEGKFLRLKFLEMSDCDCLVCWTAEDTHFPLLERLVLRSMRN